MGTSTAKSCPKSVHQIKETGLYSVPGIWTSSAGQPSHFGQVTGTNVVGLVGQASHG